METTLPLKGIKILDFSTYAAAPICAMTLADWDADVIKIESLTGDMFRYFGFIMHCPVQDDDNIQCIVYAYLNGYGDRGPDKDKPGFDLSAFFARSGILVEMPEPGSPPLAGFGDHPTGTILAGGICAALLRRERTGMGCKVQTSLFNSALWSLQLNIAAANNNAHLPEEEYNKIKGRRTKPRSALMNTYQSKDGRWITIMALEYDRYWKPFAEIVLRRPDLADDQRFSSQAAGFQHAEALTALIDEALGTLTEEEILSRLKTADIAHEVNLRWKEIKDDLQAKENGFIMECTMPSGRRDWVMGNPVRFNGEKTSIRRYAPRLGEHNEEILSELGYGAERIAAWRANMIIK